MNPLLSAAQRAFDETEFYGSIYPCRPTCLDEIPFINHSHYHQAMGILDCITDRSEVSGALAAYHRNARKFPFNIVEGETEQQQRHKRLIHALSILGITSKNSNRFLLIADDASGPFAGELATCLAWEHHQASIVFHHGSDAQLHEDITCYKPDYLLNVSIFSSGIALKGLDQKMINVHHVDQLIPDKENLLLACDEIGIFACRKDPADPFVYDQENLLIETNPHSRLPALTTQNFRIAPFIRYSPGHYQTKFDA